MSTPVLSVEALRDWLLTQPGKTTYSYLDMDDCLAARFLKAGGAPSWRVSASHLSVEVNDVVQGDPATESPRSRWTYAAALSRAEALLTTGRAAS